MPLGKLFPSFQWQPHFATRLTGLKKHPEQLCATGRVTLVLRLCLSSAIKHSLVLLGLNVFEKLGVLNLVKGSAGDRGAAGPAATISFKTQSVKINTTAALR